MSDTWTTLVLLNRLAPRGAHPAIVLAGETDVKIITNTELSGQISSLAGSLRGWGVMPGARVGLSGPSSPDWIIVALALIATGAIMVPLDDQWDATLFETALGIAKVHRLIATGARLHNAQAVTQSLGIPTLRLDGTADDAGCWRALPRGVDAPFAGRGPDDPVMLAWTSGTTGQPKLFPLSQRNIAANIEALISHNLVDDTDRALLPLPLYHAYPFIVGVLTTLTIGTAIILPAGQTGPLIVKALRSGGATALIGVPRLFEAIINVLDARFAAYGGLARLLWRGTFAVALRLDRHGIRAGKLLFGPLRRALSPQLRLLVAGGARLDAAIEERLTTLGWTVLTGYGLAETASLFTGNLPNDRRAGSAGKPLGGGEIRIAKPDAAGIGEVQLRGPAVTQGYLDNPAANAATFTEDGWFRTGDLGFTDPDGFLFITGRAKEMLVLGGGKKVSPEDLEKIYATGAGIAELGILESGGTLVALVRPDSQALKMRGIMNPRDGVDVALTGQAQGLPSYQRLAGFALTENPLPRTRLGKLRRFLLPQLYAEAQAGTVKRTARPLTGEDMQTLADPTAAAIWEMLQARWPEQKLDFDSSLSLDLSLDSFGWMELALALQDRFGVALSDTDIAGVNTIRDLLTISLLRRAAPDPGHAVPVDLDHWLGKPGPLTTLAGFCLAMLNKLAVGSAFRLRTVGLTHLPASGGFVLTPNHVSDLDPPAVAASLPWRFLRRVHWAGDMNRLFSSTFRRAFCRAVHLFPVDEMHPDAALTAAGRVLASGEVQVWFPEGWRSPDDQLRRFMPGIGQLLRHNGCPAVPVWIAGTFEALPRNHQWPRLVKVTVIYGEPVGADTLLAEGQGQTGDERIAEALRRRVLALRPA